MTVSCSASKAPRSSSPRARENGDFPSRSVATAPHQRRLRLKRAVANELEPTATALELPRDTRWRTHIGRRYQQLDFGPALVARATRLPLRRRRSLWWRCWLGPLRAPRSPEAARHHRRAPPCAAPRRGRGLRSGPGRATPMAVLAVLPTARAGRPPPERPGLRGQMRRRLVTPRPRPLRGARR